MNSFVLPDKKTILAATALFALVSFIFGVAAFQTAAIKGTFDNTDQANIGIMALRLSDPTVYARDYVFQDTRLFEFYTPIYLGLVRLLTRSLGIYDRALAVMTPVVLFVYLVGIFLFLYQITQNSLVSAWIGLISASQKVTIAATFWGVLGINTMMPRTIFLMVLPWLLLLWFLWLEDPGWWKMPLIAFLIGLAANLHPVSGFVVLQIFMLMLLLTVGFTRAGIVRLGASAVAALVGAWPTLTNFVNNSTPEVTGVATAVPFATFYAILHERLDTLFPIHPENLNFFGHLVTAWEQTAVIWLYLFSLLLIGLVAILSRQNLIRPIFPKAFFTALYLLQLPLVFLLTRFSEPALLVFSLLYLLLIFPAGPDKWDWRFLVWMTLVVCLGLVAVYFFDLVWRRFELGSLTSLGAEQMRISHFVYLPLYVFTARFLTLLHRQLPDGWERAGLIVSLGLLVLLPGIQMALMTAIFCLALLLRLRYPEKMTRVPWLRPTLGVTAVALVLNLLSSVAGAGKGLMQPALTPELQDALALYEWAHSETDPDALFYYDSLDFRFRAERSITHSWKDLGIVYYTRTLIVPFYERYHSLQGGYEDSSKLLALAETYQVNYIVVDTAVYPDLTLDLPVAFENGSYLVYQLRT